MFLIFDIAIFALNILWWIIVIQVVMSWLVGFRVIDLSQPFVRGLYGGLERITDPLYRPIRKLLPDFGGLDFSPLVILLLVTFLFNELQRMSILQLSGG